MATIASITVDDGGESYTNAPNIEISGGGGTGAQAHATVVDGVVTAITVDVAGTGYTNVPTVTVRPGSGGTGTGCVATAVLS